MKKAPFSAILRRLWSHLRSTYWFLPALVIAGCVALSYGMLTADNYFPTEYITHLGWVYTRDPSGARDLLSVISQSMITVAGVVFSITVVALTMASNQFGTRVLKSFARDAGNQCALGTFLGTFLYGILVMRRVESARNFVPSLSVAVGIFLAAASVIVLVYFIHHVVAEIQAENVVSAVSDDLYQTMDSVFPESIRTKTLYARESLSPQELALIGTIGQRVSNPKEGFVLDVDYDKLVHLAIKSRSVIRLHVLPGDFARENCPLATFWPENKPAVAKFPSSIRSCIPIGRQRSYDGDIGFGLQQLGLIAVRSLSPAINALGAAMDSNDRLIASLIRLGGREIPSPYHRDDSGKLRVISPAWDLERLIGNVLDPIRYAAAANPTVVAQMMRGLFEAETRVRNCEVQKILRLHFERFAATAVVYPQEEDRRCIRELYDSLRRRRAAA